LPVIEKVAPEEALERVTSALGDLATDLKLNHGQVDLHCAPENLVEVATKLRDGEGIQCRFFTFLSGIDWSEFGDEDEGEDGDQDKRPSPFEVLVHLYSPDHALHVNIHVPLADAEDPTCPSITSVFAGANWHERETWEMYGIRFPGHPALVNLYLPEDFEGHPLLKSFKLPTRIVKPWPGAKDPEEAAGGKS
jgi:NADH-quinone oxidoreductase subunit C